MGKEIELKFLLNDSPIPIPKKFKKSLIKQAYIHSDMDKQVRIRLVDGTGIIGIKYYNGLIRDEFEYEIPLDDAEFIYEKSENKLEKKRLSFKRFNEHYDVDTFPNGIQFVEVEFKSIKHMSEWVKPSWIGDEITNDQNYSNVVLSKQKLRF